MSTREPLPQAASGYAPWQASIELGFARRGQRTVLAHRRQRGPLAVQRPFYPEGELSHIYLLHPPGGVVGGDQLDIQADVQSAASVLVTTPGATKFYLSAGEVALQQQRMTLADDASLEWLPQENIFFPGARCAVTTRIELSPASRFIGWEVHCLGRPVIQEPFDHGQLDSSLQVYQQGRPLLLERLRLDQQAGFSSPATTRGHPVHATLLATPVESGLLNRLREEMAQPEHAHLAMTLLDNLLVVRYMGNSTEQARACFIRIWSLLRPWVIGRQPCAPRIWAT